ncbi:MAG: hypothetical protein P4L42_10745 [Desulfocapsaceae bacterium]|nr:hypothetical protein [Desulfocapsaceae bacterium]
MIIAKHYRSACILLLAGIVVVSILVSILPDFILHGSLLINERVRSFLEALGAMAAISMSLLLLQLHRDGQRQRGEFFLLSMGFLMMGVFDAFVAVSIPGHGFNLLYYSFRNIFGGLWFVLVWWPGSARFIARLKAVPWTVVLLSFLAGLVTLRFRCFFPAMIENGEFTPFARMTGTAAGIFMIATAVYFLLEFLRSGSLESYLFTCVFVLLGLSAYESRLSPLWTEDWWLWHMQRFLACIAVYYYVFASFLRVRKELREMNRDLEVLVAERTAALSLEIAEREKAGQESDQLILELQDALAHINTLTGLLPTCSSCKRIKDAGGSWIQMEIYIQNHSEAKFSHGLCPACTKRLYPEVYDKIY